VPRVIELDEAARNIVDLEASRATGVRVRTYVSEREVEFAVGGTCFGGDVVEDKLGSDGLESAVVVVVPESLSDGESLSGLC
jgi:hypothetical protein